MANKKYIKLKLYGSTKEEPYNYIYIRTAYIIAVRPNLNKNIHGFYIDTIDSSYFVSGDISTIMKGLDNG